VPHLDSAGEETGHTSSEASASEPPATASDHALEDDTSDFYSTEFPPDTTDMRECQLHRCPPLDSEDGERDTVDQCDYLSESGSDKAMDGSGSGEEDIPAYVGLSPSEVQFSELELSANSLALLGSAPTQTASDNSVAVVVARVAADAEIAPAQNPVPPSTTQVASDAPVDNGAEVAPVQVASSAPVDNGAEVAQVQVAPVHVESGAQVDNGAAVAPAPLVNPSAMEMAPVQVAGGARVAGITGVAACKGRVVNFNESCLVANSRCPAAQRITSLPDVQEHGCLHVCVMRRRSVLEVRHHHHREQHSAVDRARAACQETAIREWCCYGCARCDRRELR
jgi:hypothetical protein